MDLVQVQNVKKIFQEGANPVYALAGVSLSIAEGCFTAFSGPSGSGKTTLLNLIGCLDRPSEGKIFIDGEETSGLSQQKLARIRLRKIGFIFQDYNLIPTFSAAENIEYVLWLQGVGAAERRKRSLEIGKRFGIDALLHRRPSQMSRGQQQRVAVARALVHKPRLVLGDELTANLDQKTGRDLMSFLKELHEREGLAIIFATHDPIMLDYAQSVVRIQDGKILEHTLAKS